MTGGLEPPDHYSVLGVDRSADRAEIRAAYLAAARKAHPDNVAATAIDPRRADDRIREVNEAWRVLGDDKQRAHYDKDLHRSRKHGLTTDVGDRGRATPPTPTTGDGGEFTVTSPFVANLLRHLPWIAAAVVLGAIVLFSAYAGSSDEPASSDLRVGDCVAFSGPGAHAEVPCGDAHDGVLDEVRGDDECSDPDAFAFRPRSRSVVYCLIAPD